MKNEEPRTNGGSGCGQREAEDGRMKMEERRPRAESGQRIAGSRPRRGLTGLERRLGFYEHVSAPVCG